PAGCRLWPMPPASRRWCAMRRFTCWRWRPRTAGGWRRQRRGRESLDLFVTGRWLGPLPRPTAWPASSALNPASVRKPRIATAPAAHGGGLMRPQPDLTPGWSSRISSRGPAVAFACTSVFAESAQDVAIRLGADAAVALYVNGARVLADEAETGFAFDQRVIAAHLERGWNTLLVKLYRSTGGPWRLAVRVTAPAGGGVALKVDPLQASGAFGAQASSSRAAPALDLLAVAQAAAQNAGSAENLEILGELERTRGRGSLVHLER